MVETLVDTIHRPGEQAALAGGRSQVFSLRVSSWSIIWWWDRFHSRPHGTASTTRSVR